MREHREQFLGISIYGMYNRKKGDAKPNIWSLIMAKKPTEGKGPRVVFDLKMPPYQFRQGKDRSMSVDRKRLNIGKPAADCLSNLST
jgi:hypothetical protein